MLSVREISEAGRIIGATGNKPGGSDFWSFRSSARNTLRLSLRVVGAIAIIALTTFVLVRLVPVNQTTAGFVFLLVILFVATKGGLVESTIGSVVAMLCFNFFFLPPTGTLTVAEPQNWVALFSFLATSLTASQLSARARRRTLEAEQRGSEVERLYALSRTLLLVGTTEPIAKQVVHHLASTCEFPDVALYIRSTGHLYRAGFINVDIESKLRESAVRSTVLKDEGTDVIVTPIRLGGEPIGSLAFSGGSFSDAALQSLLNLVAIAIERANSQKAVTQAEVSRQSEELKSTLLDAIAHEFKTPLTSIKAVTTDLLSALPQTLTAHEHELISIVDESTDRLSKLVTDAIQLARIEGGTFRLNLGDHFPRTLVNAALRQMKPVIVEHRIEVVVSDDLPPVRVDAELIQLVITHMLDNALKYSPPSNPIIIGARLAERKVIVYLSDQGQGIQQEEQAKVFEKFYRGKNERHLRGTGMGLAIAREILRAHGEDISLSSVPGRGSEFSFGLPVAPGVIAQ